MNRNNQFKGMRLRSMQEFRAATSRILEHCGQQWYEGVFELWIHHRRTLFLEKVNRLSSALKFIQSRRQRRHKISADVRRVAISSHFILIVVFLKINIFY